MAVRRCTQRQPLAHQLVVMFGHEDETGVSRSEVDHQAFGRLLGGSQVHPDSAFLGGGV